MIKNKLTQKRDAFLSELAAFMGGYNSRPPIDPGHMMLEDFYDDDYKLAEYIKNTIHKRAQHELKKEIINLKAEIYDLKKELEYLKNKKED